MADEGSGGLPRCRESGEKEGLCCLHEKQPDAWGKVQRANTSPRVEERETSGRRRRRGDSGGRRSGKAYKKEKRKKGKERKGKEMEWAGPSQPTMITKSIVQSPNSLAVGSFLRQRQAAEAP